MVWEKIEAEPTFIDVSSKYIDNLQIVFKIIGRLLSISVFSSGDGDHFGV